MIRKSTLLAVAASAALGLAMLAPTSASAMRGGGGGGMHGGVGMHGGGGGMHGGHGGGGRIGHIGHIGHHHPHWHVRYHRPIWYGVRTVGYTGYTVARPVVASGPCTCLSKEYTPDGRVLFKDLCTNEAAINPPVVAPQQSSSIDAPVQQASNAQYQTAPANALPQVDPLTGQPK
jgi:hypothetical protein